MPKEKLEDLRHLFSLICLDLVAKELNDGKVCWQLEPIGIVNTICKKLDEIEATKMEHIGVYEIKLTSIEDIKHTLLSAKEFWWAALKKDDNGNLMPEDKGRGIIILKNPFCGCISIEEAQIKADVSGVDGLLRFSFVYDPITTTSF